MIKEVFALAVPVARIIDRQQGTKYLREILKLEQDILNEENQSRPDDARLHRLYVELSTIVRVMGSKVDPQTT